MKWCGTDGTSIPAHEVVTRRKQFRMKRDLAEKKRQKKEEKKQEAEEKKKKKLEKNISKTGGRTASEKARRQEKGSTS